MISGAELKRRRSEVNKGWHIEYVGEPLSMGYHNRSKRRETAHKIHRSKWNRFSYKVGKTVQILPKIYRTA